MGIRETWNEQSSGAKIAILVVGGLAALIVFAVVVVVVAAIIGSFVLGIGGETGTTPPEFSADCTINDNTVTITHSGGDSIPVSNLFVEEVPAEQVTMPATTWSAGDEIRIQGTTSATLFWTDPETGETSFLVEC